MKAFNQFFPDVSSLDGYSLSVKEASSGAIVLGLLNLLASAVMVSTMGIGWSSKVIVCVLVGIIGVGIGLATRHWPLLVFHLLVAAWCVADFYIRITNNQVVSALVMFVILISAVNGVRAALVAPPALRD